MPARFPGMDPWIESQRWEQFHFEFIGEADAEWAERLIAT